MATTKDQLNRYFAMIDRRVPTRVSQFIRWLRKPSSFAVRLVVALLLVLGGFFSFLPVLGLWMLPLGLLFIAQDVPILQKPLVSALAWVEAKWEGLKARWGNRFPGHRGVVQSDQSGLERAPSNGGSSVLTASIEPPRFNFASLNRPLFRSRDVS